MGNMATKMNFIAECDVQVEDCIIGSGFLGVVKRGMYKGELVALKSLHLLQSFSPVRLDPEQRQYLVSTFRKECELLASLDHPNILAALGVVTRGAEPIELLFLVTPFMQDGSLKHLLYDDIYKDMRRSRTPFTLSDANQLLILKNMFEALRYLATKQVVHRDIKPPNMLIQVDNRKLVNVKLADFGSGKRLLAIARINPGTFGVGTSFYMAPEMKETGAFKGPKVDIFSAGVVTIEMSSGRIPAPLEEHEWEGPRKIVLLEVERRAADLNAMHDMRDGIFRQVATRCLKDRPDDRADANDILSMLQDACLLARLDQEEAKIHILPDETIEWMWGDVGCGLAKNNPLRWSSAKNLQETIAELEQYSKKNAERSVEVSIVRAGNVYKELSFKTVAETKVALTRALEKEKGNMLRESIENPSDSTPVVQFVDFPLRAHARCSIC